MKTALFVWRFQPAHRGHVQAMLDAYEKGITHIIIWIWSAQKERTEENPFTYLERKKILESLLWDQPFSYEICAIPDVWDDAIWYKYVINNLPKFDSIISGNPWIEWIFKAQWYHIFVPHITCKIKWTNTRKAIAMNDTAYIHQAVNDDVYKYLLDIDAPKRIQKLMPNLHKYVIRYTTNIFQKDWSQRKEDIWLPYSIEPFDWVANMAAHKQIILHTKDMYDIDIEINNPQPTWIETYNDVTDSYNILLVFQSTMI